MSLWDFGLGYVVGEAAANERNSGTGCYEILLYVPMLVEGAAAGSGLSRAAIMPLVSAKLDVWVYLLIWATCFPLGITIYRKVMGLFGRTDRLRLIAGLISGIVWTGVLWYLMPNLHQNGGGIFLSLCFFAAITAMKKYSMKVFR